MARFPGHRKGRSAVSREERTVSVVGGCSDSSFIPAAVFHSLEFSKQGLNFISLIENNIPLPQDGKNQTGHFSAQTPAHLSTCR